MSFRRTKIAVFRIVQWQLICCAILLISATLLAEDSRSPVSFNRDVRPILSDKCMFCHGPDKATREADLRLDHEQTTHERVLVAGHPDKSELFRRITAEDEDEMMPPSDSGRTLTKKDIEVLRRWIQEGGRYEEHWSFIAPARGELRKVSEPDRVQNPIDTFVLSRLEDQQLSPSKRAAKQTLLRRVTFDLTGLPPTLKELETFLADDSEDAYERVVDRLLRSPRYGEHMARYWLDAARYADTNGFFVDMERSMWRWRDWVIDAFNENMPFDQFTIEQLAGDLLPDATLDQKIASGFNRNHMITRETGAIEEEYRVEYVVDRVHTTATTWLGLTVACARCHDHKFDPISQKEFFSLFAFFNNVPEDGVSKRSGNAIPLLQLPSEDLEQQLSRINREIVEIEKKVAAIEPKFLEAQTNWEQFSLTHQPKLPTEDLLAHFRLDDNAANDGLLASHAEADGNVEFEKGFLGQAAKFDGDSVLEFNESISIDYDTPFSMSAWVKPTGGRPACVLSKNDDVKKLRGFDLMIVKNKPIVHLIHQWNHNAISVTTKKGLAGPQWQHLCVTYDGSSSAAGVKIYVDGESQQLEIEFDSLSGSIQTEQPLRVGRRSTSAAFVGLIDDVRLYEEELPKEQVDELFRVQLIDGVASLPRDGRPEYAKQQLLQHFLNTPEAAEFREVYEMRKRMLDRYTELKTTIPSMMVMQESEQPRETFVLIRGQYDQPGEKVDAGVPAFLPPFSDALPRNRLGFAKWLVDPANPLTARVAVNRYWQQFFGTGLVKSTDDFGSQGQWPSHPQLLDWLAVEYQESGWDTKHLLKLIVMSATYQQESRITKESWERDPENRLLARGPRFRMDAEVVRDNALAISGLLENKLGGPSVKPYQPAGLWKAVSYGGDLSYVPDYGNGLYRRSLYTYWKRQSPPPALMAFDAPTRETCTVSRPRTNTPMQALVLMNDVTYVEAARLLAQQMMELSTDRPADRIVYAFRLATSRKPLDSELAVLQKTFQRQLNRFQNDEQAALALLSVGESDRAESLDVSHHAAWTIVASMILNLNETITKN